MPGVYTGKVVRRVQRGKPDGEEVTNFLQPGHKLAFLFSSNHECVSVFVSDAAPSYYCTCLQPLSGDGDGKKKKKGERDV